MDINAANWVGEYTLTTGTGPITLAGAIRGFARFNVMGDGQVYYVIQDGVVKETGLGTLTGNVLERTLIHATIDDKGVYSKTPVPITLSGNAQVYGIVNAEFMQLLYNSSQTVLDAVETVTDAANSAADSKDAAAQSAVDSASYASSASSAASNAASSEQVTVENTASVIDMTAEVNAALQVVLSAAASIAGSFSYPYHYIAESDGQTSIVLPPEVEVSSVTELYLEGIHQDVGKHFLFDADTKTIYSLAQPLNIGDELTIMITGPAGGGNPFQDLLASEAGASNIGKMGGGTVQDFIDSQEKNYKMISVLDYMSDEEIASANNPNGTVDHSNAFVQAFADAVTLGIRVIYVPPVAGRYIVGDVTVPGRTRLIGHLSYKLYDFANEESFNNCGSVIRKKTGSATQFKWNSGCSAENILFDGVDRTASAIFSATGGKITTYFDNCGFYRWARVGNDNGKYIACAFRFCSFNQNNIGIYNTVDGNHIGCVINANRIDGVRLETGANSNTFIGCRNEWNGGDAVGNNWNIYGCTSIMIIGEICDRASGYGFRISNSSVTVSGVAVRRSGRTATGLASSHFYIENSTFKHDGVVTSSGADDSGGSITTPSPNYVYRWGGATGAGLFQAANCNINSGVLGVYANAIRALEIRITNCQGLDNQVNVGLARQSNGHYYYDVKTDTKTIGSTPVSLALSVSPLALHSNDMQWVQIAWRNTSGGSNGMEMLILRSREGGVSSINILSILCKNGVISELDVDDPATPSTQLYTVSATCNDDASIVTVSMKAKSTNTNNFYVRSYLKS